MSHLKSTCHLSEAQFLCSICLDVFTDPVSIPCGHNFCKACITQHWDMDTRCKCPLCQRPHVPRPDLYVNTVFSDFIAEFRQSAENRSSRKSKQPEYVHGDYHPQEIVDSGPQAPGSQSLRPVHPEDNMEVRKVRRRNPGFYVVVQNCVCCPDSQTHPESLESVDNEPNPTPTQLLHRSHAGEDMQAQRQAKLRTLQQYYVEITLDPATSHPSLLLDREAVANRNRLDRGVYVLGMQKFTTGRFYYEVKVKGETPWAIGLAVETVWSRGYFKLCPQNGYWTIWFSDRALYALMGPPVPLNQPMPMKVGVYLDYEEGVISFYNTHTAALIFSFTGCCFTHRLLPFFCPMLNEGSDIIPVI